MDRAVDSETIVFTELDTSRDVLTLDKRLEALEQANEFTGKQVRDWTETLDEADTADQFFASITGFTVVGQVPTK